MNDEEQYTQMQGIRDDVTISRTGNAYVTLRTVHITPSYVEIHDDPYYDDRRDIDPCRCASCTHFRMHHPRPLPSVYFENVCAGHHTSRVEPVMIPSVKLHSFARRMLLRFFFV